MFVVFWQVRAVAYASVTGSFGACLAALGGMRRGLRSCCLPWRCGVGCGEAAAQDEVLAVGGFQFAAQQGDFLVVAAFEVGQLGGEGGDHPAGGFRAGGPGPGGVLPGTFAGLGALLVAELLDALPQWGAGVEEVQGYPGVPGQAAEGDRLAGAEHIPESCVGAGGRGGSPGGCRGFEVLQVPGTLGGHAWLVPFFPVARAAAWLVRAVTPAPRTACGPAAPVPVAAAVLVPSPGVRWPGLVSSAVVMASSAAVSRLRP